MISFGNRMQEIDGIRQNILTEQSELVSRQTQQLNTFKNEADHRLDAHQQQIEQRIKQAIQQISQTEIKYRQIAPDGVLGTTVPIAFEKVDK